MSMFMCEVDESLKAKVRELRCRRETNNAAILMKMDREKQMIMLEKEYEDISLDELRAELPEREPRFIVYSAKYVHADGTVSYPLCLIFSGPVGSRPDHLMRYAGSKDQVVEALELTEVFDTRNTDDLTEEWLRNKLAYLG